MVLWLKDEGKRISKAFVILGVMSYLGVDATDALSLITEGGDDACIDAIHIGDVVNYEFMVTIFQGKYNYFCY